MSIPNHSEPKPDPNKKLEFVRNGETIGILHDYQDAIFMFNSICSELMHKHPELFECVTLSLEQEGVVFKRC